MAGRVPDVAVLLAVKFEGLAKVKRDGLIYPYRCPAGIPTIGYGSTRYMDGSRVQMTDPAITKAQAEAMLMHELEACTASVLRLCPGVHDQPFRLSALIDFVYNFGAGRLQTSTLRRRVNQRDWPAAAYEIRRWNKAGGKVLAGLVARREAEAQLLLRKP